MDYKERKNSNMVYQENPEGLSKKRIMEFVNHHNKYQQPRLETLDSYYIGENIGITKVEKRRVNGGSDVRIPHPFAQEISDFQASFSVGIPITIDVEKENHDTLDDINKTNDVDTLFGDVFLDIGKYGKAYMLVYRESGSDLEKFVRLEPINTFMIYDDEVDFKPLMAVRYQPVMRETLDGNTTQINWTYDVETWDASEHNVYRNMSLADVLKDKPDMQEQLITMPVVEFWNNSLRIGDYENVIPLIDAYDGAQSDTANYMKDLNDAMLVIKGDIDSLTDGLDLSIDPDDPNYSDKLAEIIELKTRTLKELGDANILLLKSGNNAVNGQTNLDAGYIHKEYDVNGVEKYKDRLYKNIHTLSRTPDISDESFAGNASGVAMRYKQLGVIQQAKTKRRMFERGLYSLYSIVQDLEHGVSGKWGFDYNEIKFTFHDNLPIDEVETITSLVNAGATFPQKYLYSFAPNVVDTDELDEMMQEQRAAVNPEDERLQQRDNAQDEDDEGDDNE